MSDAPHPPDHPGESGRPKSLGEILKSARLSRGLELGDIAELTHVRKDYLKALEEGAYSELPEDVYSRNFLRLYAQAVGLGSDKLIDAYLHERRLALGGTTAEMRGEEPRRRERRERGEGRSRPGIQIGTWLPTLLLVAAVVALAVWGFNTLLFNPGRTTTLNPVEPSQPVPQTTAEVGPVTSGATETPVAPATTPVLDEVLIDIDTEPPGASVTIDGFSLPGITPLRSMPVTPRANRLVRVALEGFEPFEQSFDLSFGRTLTIVLSPEATAQPTPLPEQAEAAPVTGQGQIAIEITETTWLEVYQSTARNSGQRLVYTTVQPGERFVFDLPVYVHVGNAAGVQVTVAGQEIGVLGSSGAVLGRAFDQ